MTIAHAFAFAFAIAHAFELRLHALAAAYADGTPHPRVLLQRLRAAALSLNPDCHLFIPVLGEDELTLYLVAANGPPWGMTLFGRAFTDQALLGLAVRCSAPRASRWWVTVRWPGRRQRHRRATTACGWWSAARLSMACR